jgi:aspartate/methionine/tyrosine aminotransferase
MPKHPLAAPTIAGMPASVYSSLGERAARSGREVFPLHVGDTWMEPAPGARMEELRVAEHPGMHRYAPVRGIPELLEVVVARQRVRTGLAGAVEEVLLTGGATSGLGAVVGATVVPGDEVLILAPYWPLIAGIVRTFGGVPVPVPVLGEAAPSAAALRAAIDAHRTERTVAIYVNTPNNPTGRVLAPELLVAVTEAARAHGWWIYADEVYEDLQYDGVHTPLRPLAPERTFAAHSFSKTYGMAGNRLGYVVGPADGMREVSKVGLYTVYSAPTASQLAALQVLTPAGDAWLARAKELYQEIGGNVAATLGLPAPQGGTFLFFDLQRHLDGRGLAGFLEDCADDGLLLAPGPSFGPFPTHVRLCFTATPPEVTYRGVERLAARLDR